MTHTATRQPFTILDDQLPIHAGRAGVQPDDDAVQMLHGEAGHDAVFAEFCTHPACLIVIALQAELDDLRAEHASLEADHSTLEDKHERLKDRHAALTGRHAKCQKVTAA
jgi:FtsZ-binding cell division protein ZapB